MKTLLTIFSFPALCAVVLWLLPFTARAQSQPLKFGIITNQPALILGSMTSNVNSGTFYVREGKGVAILAKFAGTNAATVNTLTVKFDVSHDNTNWSTLTPLTLSAAINGTAQVIAFTNFTPLLLDNVRFMRVKSIQNGDTNAMFVSNLTYSYFN